MKGLELPINVLVIVAVAIVVLLAIVALYFGGFSPFSAAMSLEGVKNDQCRKLVQANNCGVNTNTLPISNFDADKDGAVGTTDTGTGWTWGTSTCVTTIATNGDNLASLCYCQYGRTTEAACRQLCGCP